MYIHTFEVIVSEEKPYKFISHIPATITVDVNSLLFVKNAPAFAVVFCPDKVIVVCGPELGTIFNAPFCGAIPPAVSINNTNPDETPFKPALPVGPVSPVTPAPVAPVMPVGPVGPVGPLGPRGCVPTSTHEES